MFALVGISGRAWAQDPFEIQVYDSETAPAWQPGIELHVNQLARGDGPDKGFHLTFEPHLGLTDWAELGAYVQTAAPASGGYDYAGTKVRLKLRWPRKWSGVGLALNGELSFLPRRFDPQRYGSELRPIIDCSSRRVYASLNPIIGFEFTGPQAGSPQLEPAAKLAAVFFDAHLLLGAEYYAALGSLHDPLPAHDQVHRLLGTIDLGEFDAGPVVWSLNLGAGYGWGGEKLIAKAIVGLAPR